MTAVNEPARANLLSRAEAARYLGVSVSTLATWACTGRYNLPYVRLGRLAKYRAEDLDAFISNSVIERGAA